MSTGVIYLISGAQTVYTVKTKALRSRKFLTAFYEHTEEFISFTKKMIIKCEANAAHIAHLKSRQAKAVITQISTDYANGGSKNVTEPWFGTETCMKCSSFYDLDI